MTRVRVKRSAITAETSPIETLVFVRTLVGRRHRVSGFGTTLSVAAISYQPPADASSPWHGQMHGRSVQGHAHTPDRGGHRALFRVRNTCLRPRVGGFHFYIGQTVELVEAK